MRERIAHSLWFKQNTGFLNILDIFKRNRRDERADPPSNLNESILLQQRKRLALTEEGELLRNAALCMLHDEEKLKRDVKDLRLGRRSIRFGATLTIGEYLLPERLAAYMKRNPRVDVHMLVENTQILLRMINDGELDFAVVEGYFRKSEYDYIIWSQEPYVCVCAAAHPLAQAAPRPLSALFGENLILRNQGSGSRDVLERVLEERN
ncbi:hypothetical protein EGR95_13975, partial [bacterium]|nr:hypothetical protein [bacterium]